MPVDGIGQEQATEEKNFGYQENPHPSVAVSSAGPGSEIVRTALRCGALGAPLLCFESPGFATGVQKAKN